MKPKKYPNKEMYCYEYIPANVHNIRCATGFSIFVCAMKIHKFSKNVLLKIDDISKKILLKFHL